VLDFKLLYQQNCAGCHGADGQLGPAPPLNDELFRAIISEYELLEIVMKGRQGTLMPAFAIENGGTLTPKQIQVLVNEIKGIPYKVVEKTPGDPSSAEVVAAPDGPAPAWGKPKAAPADVPPYRAPSEKLDVQTARGMAAFTRACAECHGDKGQGLGEGSHLTNAINDPVFLALNSDQVLRRIIITGRSDLGMPNFAEPRMESPDFKPLSPQEVNDLVALLASWRRIQTTKTSP
jgi:cytochrome c oxidase cbb3-type subunit III